MARITVKHRHSQTFDINIRGYALLSDEPVPIGEDEGPSPTELMVAGLASCAAEEAMKSLAALGLPYQDLEIEADFAWDVESERVASVRLVVSLPSDLDEAAASALEAAMMSCPARKMLTQPPSVQYDFSGSISKSSDQLGSGRAQTR
jgi:putative redox protein